MRILLPRALVVAIAAVAALLVGRALFDAEENDKADGAVTAREVEADAAGTAVVDGPGDSTAGVIRLEQKGARIGGWVVLRGLPSGRDITLDLIEPNTRCSAKGAKPRARIELRSDTKGRAIGDLRERSTEALLEPNLLLRVKPADAPRLCGYLPLNVDVPVATPDRKAGGGVSFEQRGLRLTGRVRFNNLHPNSRVPLEALAPGEPCESDSARRLLALKTDSEGIADYSIDIRRTPVVLIPELTLRVMTRLGMACGRLPSRLLPRTTVNEDDNNLTAQMTNRRGDASGLIKLSRTPSEPPVFHDGFLIAWGVSPGARYEAAIRGPGGTCQTQAPTVRLDIGTLTAGSDGTIFKRFAQRIETSNLLEKGFYATLSRPGAEPRERAPLCGNLLAPDTENLRDFTIESENGRPTGDELEISVAKFDTVRLVVRADERTADTVLVRGYGIAEPVSRTSPAELLFPASIAGEFEIVMKSTGARLATLNVSG